MSKTFEEVKNCPYCGKAPRFKMLQKGVRFEYCFGCSDVSCKGGNNIEGHEKLDVAAKYWNEWASKQKD